MTTDEIIMTRPKEQDYFIRATYVRQLENYCDELENEIIEHAARLERDVAWAKCKELEADLNTEKDIADALDKLARANYEKLLAAEAKLAEIEAQQEPVIWQSWHDSYGYGYWDTLKEAELNSAVDFEPVPLYAAPGAKQ